MTRQVMVDALRDAWVELTDTVGVPVGVETDTGQVSLSAVKKFGALLEAALTQPAEPERELERLRAALTKVAAVLTELERLDALQERLSKERSAQAKEQREWARQMDKWNAGEIEERPQRPAIQQPHVVDYGDVMVQFQRLAPIVRQALTPQP